MSGTPDTGGDGEPGTSGSAGNTTTVMPSVSVAQKIKLVKKDDLVKFITTHELAATGKGAKKEGKYQSINIRSLH